MSNTALPDWLVEDIKAYRKVMYIEKPTYPELNNATEESK